MRIGTIMPALDEGRKWLNSKPLRREDLIGRWTLIYFWSISCEACQQQFGNLQQLCKHYKQLQLVSIHMPRSEADKSFNDVKQSIRNQNRLEPIVFDDQLVLADRFGVRFVPSYYVFDTSGALRYFQGGNRSQALLKRRLERLLTK